MNLRIQQPIIHPPAVRQQNEPKSKNESFQQLLNREIDQQTTLKVSKHAESRLRERGITIQPETWVKIESGIQQAKNKGVSDALIITNETAMVVSAKNKTVITAMDRTESNVQIFTNINGTILIDE